MFCQTCGVEIPDGTKFCGQCGQSVRAPHSSISTPAATLAAAAPQLPPSRALSQAGIRLVSLVGLLVGGFVGFLMRPAVILIGQLPFGTVVTRGSTLSGIDQLLVPAAHQSFNITILGAVIGAAGAFGLGRLLAKPRVSGSHG